MPTTVNNIPQDRDEELREQILVNKRRAGGDPSLLLDLLVELIERESWKARENPDGSHWSFLRYVQTPFDEGGLGWNVEEVKNIIRFEHKFEKEGPRQDPDKVAEMKRLRATIKDLLNPDAKNHGGDRRSDQVDNINLKGGGTSESYAVRRLKRDNPELARKVINGDMTANAAAIEAGFRTKKISVPVMKGGEPQIERAADALQKHFGDAFPDLVDELMSRLEVAA